MGGGGLFGSLKRLLATSIGIVRTRAELLTVEFEAEVRRLSELFLFALIALFFIGLAIVLLTILIVVAFWDENRLFALGVLATFFACTGLFSGWLFLSRARARSALFSGSLAELSRDLKELE